MPSRRTAVGAAAVLLVALLVLGFAVVDASALQGETATHASVGTARANDSTATMGDPVTLVVADDGWLESRLGDRIERGLVERGATVTRVSSLASPIDEPVLVVRVTDASVSYSPVSPSASVDASFAYVQSGNVTLAQSLVGGSPMVIQSATDAYVVSGDVTMTDRATGLSTWPAYQRRVADAVGSEMVNQLARAPSMDRPDF